MHARAAGLHLATRALLLYPKGYTVELVSMAPPPALTACCLLHLPMVGRSQWRKAQGLPFCLQYPGGSSRPQPAGMLVVRLTKVVGLHSGDITGHSDPYCVLQVGRGGRLAVAAGLPGKSLAPALSCWSCHALMKHMRARFSRSCCCCCRRASQRSHGQRSGRRCETGAA